MNVVLVAVDQFGLPEAAWWRVMVFEQPWVGAGVLGIAAVIAAWLGTRQEAGGRRRGMLAGAGACALACAGLIATASAVTTDRERVLERTAALVDAVAGVSASGSAHGLRGWLREDVVVSLFGSRLGVGAEQIAELAEKHLGREYPVKEHTIAGRAAVIDSPSGARSAVRVRATLREWGLSVSSQWVMHWRREGGAWRVTHVECVQIDGVGSDDPNLPRGVR